MIPNSKQLLEMAHTDWKNREERRGIHAEQPFVAGWITGYLSALPKSQNKIHPFNKNHILGYEPENECNACVHDMVAPCIGLNEILNNLEKHIRENEIYEDYGYYGPLIYSEDIIKYIKSLKQNNMVEGINRKMIPRNEDHFMNPDSKHFDPDAAAHDPGCE